MFSLFPFVLAPDNLKSSGTGLAWLAIKKSSRMNAPSRPTHEDPTTCILLTEIT